MKTLPSCPLPSVMLISFRPTGVRQTVDYDLGLKVNDDGRKKKEEGGEISSK